MTEIITKDAEQQLTAESKDIVGQANSLSIKTEAENVKATAILKAIKTMRTKVEETFGPSVKAAKAAYDEAKDLRDQFLNPLKTCEADLRSKIGGFVTAENARREALQAKADAKFEKAAEKAEATGKPLTAAPQFIPSVKATAAASFSTTWYAEVTDIVALCKAIVEGKADPGAVMPNMVLLNGLAKAHKAEKEILPGVVAKKKTVTRV